MIFITEKISLHESELHFAFTRSGGPGGQNVNKVSTAVHLRFAVWSSEALPYLVKERLARLAGRKLTEDGWLLIIANRFRSQDQNRSDAVERLCDLIRRAATPPKPRHKTKPTRSSKKRRLESKRRRSLTKKNRLPPSSHEE